MELPDSIASLDHVGACFIQVFKSPTFLALGRYPFAQLIHLSILGHRDLAQASDHSFGESTVLTSTSRHGLARGIVCFKLTIFQEFPSDDVGTCGNFGVVGA
jgi:hypothetical protein